MAAKVTTKIELQFGDKAVSEDELVSKAKKAYGGKDIKNLEWASGGFHDARIAKKKLQDDDTLYLLFDGTWGCKIEVWFSGDLEYDTSSRDPETVDPYWFGATVILQDGFVLMTMM